MYGLARLTQPRGRRFGAPEDLKDAMSGEQLTWAEGDSREAVKKKKENESKEKLVVLWLVVLCCFAACF